MKTFLSIIIASIISVAITAQKSNLMSDAVKYSSSVNVNEIIHLDKETFKKQIFDYENSKEWKYQGSVPAIIDFYADWCSPCRMVAPTLEELQKDYKGKIQIYKVNTQNEKELAAAFGISGIPAFLFVPLDGEPSMGSGAMPKESFEKYIKEILKVEK
ncbi:MAG: thioredoxin domain-containing protein [Bacteroidota bacterium]